MTSRWIAPAALVAVLLLALAVLVRLWGVAAEPLWLDEAYSAFAAAHDWRYLWQVVPQYETHPPFYYSLLRAWTLLWGDGLAGLRSLGLVAGIAALPVAALAANEIGLLTRRRPAERALLVLVSLAFVGVSPVLIEMSREVRPYPLMILVYSTAIVAMLRTVRRVEETGRLPIRPLATYAVALALMLWLHNLGLLFGATLALAFGFLLVGRLPLRDWRWLVAAHLVAALLWTPALLILIDQAPTWIHKTWLTFRLETLPRHLISLYASYRPPVTTRDATILALAILAAMGLLGLAIGLRRWRLAVALALLAGLPVATAVVLSMTISPVFIVRIMTPVAVPAMLLAAIGATLPGYWRWPGLLFAGLLMFGLAKADLGVRRGPPMENWYGVARFIAERMGPGDQVWTYPNESALPFDFAVRDLAIAQRARPIPAPVPAIGWPGGWYPTGSRGVVSVPREQLRGFAVEGRSVPTIWLIRAGARTYDPGDMLVEELSRTRRPIARWRSGPIDVIGLRRTDLLPQVSGRRAAPAAATAAR